mgnify:CR=1 FL=1
MALRAVLGIARRGLLTGCAGAPRPLCRVVVRGKIKLYKALLRSAPLRPNAAASVAPVPRPSHFPTTQPSTAGEKKCTKFYCAAPPPAYPHPPTTSLPPQPSPSLTRIPAAVPSHHPLPQHTPPHPSPHPAQPEGGLASSRDPFPAPAQEGQDVTKVRVHRGTHLAFVFTYKSLDVP